MSNLKVIGKEQVSGYEFTGIEGGFGDGTRGMLVRDIADIHGTTVKRINELINKNIKRFKNGIDIANLKSNSVVVLNDLEFTQNAINRYKYIYLLSERGYSKLLKILEDDTAWDIYDKFVDGYFNMRKEIKEQPKLPSNPHDIIQTLLDASNDDHKTLVHVDERVTDLEENTPLSAGEYSYIGKRINQRVSQASKDFGGKLTSKQRGELFKDINNGVKVVAGIDTRTQLRNRHYQDVIAFINDWEPSTATKTVIRQTSLDVEEAI
ncbi:ORF6C domain-containing protein [Leuconostoc carnosum]|uniref:ORF6N domain-containing protein n=1 Tax=Leuconostoc carnosum TaxID=1252 RepID=UPI000D513849|nr:ORF6C domain-containing protein [Leuconostoc carnosum]WLC58804.1 ORF6C domain-containing protein [Leuconostoc carnosum]WLC98143.1 ORF6C domain-containing protein [Leuconostoc carnosum]SPJ44060.1 Prophage pi2 protein 06 [Leuconostoc carnosum]